MARNPKSPLTRASETSDCLSNLPASWIMHNNPGLETIELSAFVCSDSIASRTFIRTISGLQQLKRLTIHQVPDVVLDSTFAFKLFKCAPPNLESFIMNFYMYTSPFIANPFRELAQLDDSDSHLPLVERDGPLLQLKELRMPYNDNFYTGEQFNRILQSCPALERLVILQHLADGNGVMLADSVKNHCPLIRHWSIIAPMLVVHARPRDQETVFNTLNSLPTHQVETLSWQGYRDDQFVNYDPPLTAKDCLLRFADTLCHLRLIDAIIVRSSTICTILTRCTQLKSLTIRDFDAQRNFISILDAVTEPWGCTKIESLEIGVEAATTAVRPELHKWALWGAFARQIGRLTELRSLSIRSLLQKPGDASRTLYTYQTLPGLLALDARADVDLVATAANPPFNITAQGTYPANPADADIDVQRTGFLIHLAGLSKLQHLRGSFHMNLHSFTDQEANWIRTQWPRFEMLEFLPEDFFSREGYDEDAVPPAIMRFQDEMGYRVHAFPIEADRIWCVDSLSALKTYERPLPIATSVLYWTMSNTSPADKTSTPASEAFFRITEMRDAVSNQMSLSSLLTFRLVDKAFKTITARYLWNYINFRDAIGDSYRQTNPDRFLASAASVTAINENRSLVKTLSIPADFCWIYFEATIGALRTSVPWSHVPARKPDYVPIALLPFRDLTVFKWELDFTCNVKYHPFEMTATLPLIADEPTPAMMSSLPAIWVIANNPKLVSVTLSGFSCEDRVVARHLIRVLSNMPVLKGLSLWVSFNEEIPLAFTTTLFRCLPASLETLHLVYAMRDPEVVTFAESPVLGDPDTSFPTLAARQGPLSSLVNLRLPVFNDGYSTETIVQFLEQCPGLTSLMLPQSMRADQNPSTGEMLASKIQELCPLVRHISVLSPFGRIPKDRQSVIATLNVLNPVHVHTLVWESFYDVAGQETLASIFPGLNRFASTLTNLRLFRIDNLASATVSSILSGCEALKTMVLRGSTPSKYAVTLEDATAAHWVCSKLEILEMAIGLATDGSDRNLAPGNPRWPMFGSLARKIGALTHLKSLTLKATCPYSQTVRDRYPDYHIPGFLILDPNVSSSSPEADDIDKQGFLSILDGLTDLQELMGSFRHRTHQSFSAAEADWTKVHWIKLKTIEFYPCPERQNDESSNAPEVIRQLKFDKGLRICAFPEIDEDEE
ncbi:hypothetical protein BGZ95_001433 [Linnemannia exigua]|uniref:F-box domain-containing protein n=1 Tax=Linnemannia exigua TaxID=604196 RepID=A0AAD4D903_9FUNG|nr:hypothetical protein BGZ95_001433 [Linnemannia exigua]